MRFDIGQSRLLVPALLAASIGLTGCGGGGGGGSSGGSGGSSGGSSGGDDSTDVNVLPEHFDFGVVTEGNQEHTPPRQFTISNEGSTSYDISNMYLAGQDPNAFILDQGGGDAPCDALSLTLDPGDSCTIAVAFGPGQQNFGEHRALLIVESDDPNAPSVGHAASLDGEYAHIDPDLNVQVNQVNACPGELDKAYISVIDQAGYPVKGLHEDPANFTLVESSGMESQPVHVTWIEESFTNLAFSVAMDYSASITDVPGAVSNMEEGAKLLVDAMLSEDEADIIKYATEVELMTPQFTSDKGVLEAAIDKEPDGAGGRTALYDATVEAIERTTERDKDRKAIISQTDGMDNESDADVDDAIELANAAGIPVFTIGFGDFDEDHLRKLARETGGLFYEAAGDENLQQVFQQVTSLLFSDQYEIDFDSELEYGEEGSLRVIVEYERDGIEFSGEGERVVHACQ